MRISEKINKQVNGFPIGRTFQYDQLSISKDQYVAAAKVLERLQKKGVIKKVSKGTFYKPENTVFGELKPNEQELLKPYLFENGKRIAYITGNYLYNQMGLTTQVTRQLKIACRSKRIYVDTGAIKASPVKSYVDVTDINYQLLGLLDALKDLNTIPDVELQAGVTIIADILKGLKPEQLSEMIKYAIEYPPRVRALFGAILELLGKKKGLKDLKNSLNPLTQYDLKITESILPTAINWNIK